MAKKVDQTKIERIRNASVEVISEHGILGGSVASIAERADVSVGYLYRHYPGKTELINDLLENALNAITDRIHSDGSLILASLLVGYVTSLISCSQPMSHVLTGNMMKPLFKERKIAPEILSRTLEDAGTLSGPMIPWHGYCVYMAGTLGVAWFAFFPYLFLLYLTPLFSIFYGFTGISIKHIEE